MEIEVSIDKFVIDYKDVPHSAFLRFYMLGMKKYKVKIKIYSGTYSYELHIRKSDDVYIHIYFKNFRETEGHLHTLRIETRPEHYSHFKEILEMIGKRASRVEFVSCDVAYDIQTGLENIVVIPIDARRNMSISIGLRRISKGGMEKVDRRTKFNCSSSELIVYLQYK